MDILKFADYYYKLVFAESKIDPKLTWLHNALIVLFDKFNDLYFNSFVDKNKQKINQILKSINKTPRLLGKGADGIAFDIGNGMVLKLFTSKFAYQSALDAIERLHSVPELGRTEAMIYDAGEIGEFLSAPVYYWIIEKMTPIMGLDTNIDVIYDFEEITGAIEDIAKQVKNDEFLSRFESPKLLQNYLKNYSKHIADELAKVYKDTIPKISESMHLKQNWLQLLIEEILFKTITERLDLHIGNLGITNQKELRYFDPAFGGPTK